MYSALNCIRHSDCSCDTDSETSAVIIVSDWIQHQRVRKGEKICIR